MRSRSNSSRWVHCRRCGRRIHPDYVYCSQCLPRIRRNDAALLTRAPGTPARRAAAPAVPGVGEGSNLYVAVTRKGSLTNETVGSSRR